MFSEAILSPLQLWNLLIKEAGLELRLKNQPGRDADLEKAVLEKLGPTPGGLAAHSTVESLLKFDQAQPAPLITVERLLISLLESQQGFSAMMMQIMDTLITAEATIGKKNLEFSFDFFSLDGPLKTTLEQFRAQVERTRKTFVSQFIPLEREGRAGIKNILFSYLGGYAQGDESLLAKTQFSSLSVPEEFQKPLQILENAVLAFLRQWLEFGPTRSGISNRLRILQQKGDLTPGQQKQIDDLPDLLDYWDTNIAKCINNVKERLHAGSINRLDALALITQAADLVPVKNAWVDEHFRELLDILNLPAWKHRHELYSVWVGTRLLDIARQNATAFEFHPVNNVLSFSFGGNHLATYTTESGRFAIHCELRSQLVGKSSKRKDSVQPDFRVLRDDTVATPNDATRLVLECKHYLRSNKANFTNAANDYARSCNYATVLIANNGPASELDLADSVELPLRNRVRFMGNVTPERTAELLEFLKSTLFSSPSVAPTPQAPQPRSLYGGGTVITVPASYAQPLIVVKVEWDENLQDIDLSLVFTPDNTKQKTTIDFCNLGGPDAPVYAELVQDVRSGPGSETIVIFKLVSATYDILVRNYSEEGHFPAAHLCGHITIGPAQLAVRPPLLVGQNGYWKLATLVVQPDDTLAIRV